MTPLISGGSLAGILDWRSRLSFPERNRQHHRFGIANPQEDVNGQGHLNEDEIKAVIKQTLEGLSYLHERNFVHVCHLTLLLVTLELIPPPTVYSAM